MSSSGQGNDFEARKQQTTKFMKEKVIAIDEKDAQVWQLITDVPKLKAPWQYICFVLNVIIPDVLGSGTMVVSCFCEKWSKTLFMVGVFQLFLAYIIVGWIFSIYWGVLIVRKSWEDEKELNTFLKHSNLRSDQFDHNQAPPGNGYGR